jgi:hypothetical protein
MLLDHPRSGGMLLDHPRSGGMLLDHPRSGGMLFDHPRSGGMLLDHPSGGISGFNPFCCRNFGQIIAFVHNKVNSRESGYHLRAQKQ